MIRPAAARPRAALSGQEEQGGTGRNREEQGGTGRNQEELAYVGLAHLNHQAYSPLIGAMRRLSDGAQTR